MGIETVPKTAGHGPRAKIVCDGCGHGELYACDYDGAGSKAKPRKGQVLTKAGSDGWSKVKNKVYCKTSDAARKAAASPEETPAKQPNEPTRKQKLEIIDMLKTCYDTDAERYLAGDTDETLAEVLQVMPGWVAKLREELFGPDGGNEDIENLLSRVADMEQEVERVRVQCRDTEADAKRVIEVARAGLACADKKLAEVSALKADLERIRKAVGPRVCRAAKVKGAA